MCNTFFLSLGGVVTPHLSVLSLYKICPWTWCSVSTRARSIQLCFQYNVKGQDEVEGDGGVRGTVGAP